MTVAERIVWDRINELEAARNKAQEIRQAHLMGSADMTNRSLSQLHHIASYLAYRADQIRAAAFDYPVLVGPATEDHYQSVISEFIA